MLVKLNVRKSVSTKRAAASNSRSVNSLRLQKAALRRLFSFFSRLEYHQPLFEKQATVKIGVCGNTGLNHHRFFIAFF
jgi:hypothetical protein